MFIWWSLPACFLIQLHLAVDGSDSHGPQSDGGRYFQPAIAESTAKVIWEVSETRTTELAGQEVTELALLRY